VARYLYPPPYQYPFKLVQINNQPFYPAMLPGTRKLDFGKSFSAAPGFKKAGSHLAAIGKNNLFNGAACDADRQNNPVGAYNNFARVRVAKLQQPETQGKITNQAGKH